MSDRNFESGDSADLEALFDSIVATNAAHEAAPADAAKEEASGAGVTSDMVEPAKSMFAQIGHITRKLHDTLRELGYDKSLEKVVAEAIPDAKDRLAYVAKLTEQAADKVLSAVDVAKPLQEKLSEDSDVLNQRWDKLFANQLSVEEFKVLVADTRTFLHRSKTETKQTDALLLDIMMAQDFQDLTGQVIKKIVEMAKEMEAQLYNFLVEYTPGAERKPEEHTQLENGPVIHAEGRSDIVTDQQQVDDLLASLGF